MSAFLRVMLAGAIQAWGKQTYETFRPSEMFPTRSGLTGIVSAALGIPRTEKEEILNVDRSYSYAVGAVSRSNNNESRGKGASPSPGSIGNRMIDYHVVRSVHCVNGKLKATEPTLREYLTDLKFVVIMKESKNPSYSLLEIEAALRNPRYLVYLGRKSCPPGEPFIRESVFYAESFLEAFDTVKESIKKESFLFPQIEIHSFYSDEKISEKDGRIIVRDVPCGVRNRLFETRNVYIHGEV